MLRIRPAAYWRPAPMPIRLPLPGHDLAGVMTFRELADIEACSGGGRSAARS